MIKVFILLIAFGDAPWQPAMDLYKTQKECQDASKAIGVIYKRSRQFCAETFVPL